MKTLSEIKKLIETVQTDIKNCKNEDRLKRLMKFHMELTSMKRWLQDNDKPQLLN